MVGTLGLDFRHHDRDGELGLAGQRRRSRVRSLDGHWQGSSSSPRLRRRVHVAVPAPASGPRGSDSIGYSSQHVTAGAHGVQRTGRLPTRQRSQKRGFPVRVDDEEIARWLCNRLHSRTTHLLPRAPHPGTKDPCQQRGERRQRSPSCLDHPPVAVDRLPLVDVAGSGSANIFAYLPRQLTWWGLALSLGGMVLLQGYIFREKGGKIQKIVTRKTNTLDVRSATFIDLLYGIVLLFFKVDYIPKLFEAMDMTIPWPQKMPMSTTWVFLGLLAGRELGIVLRLKHRSNKKLANLIFSDAGKAFFGSAVAIVLALFLPLLAKATMGDPEPLLKPAIEQVEPLAPTSEVSANVTSFNMSL